MVVSAVVDFRRNSLAFIVVVVILGVMAAMILFVKNKGNLMVFC